METERDGVHRRQGVRLETFLVEWKQLRAPCSAVHHGALETFLVEWKPLASILSMSSGGALKPS